MSRQVRSILPLSLPWLMVLAATVPANAVYDVHVIGYVLVAGFVALVVILFVIYFRKAARGERW